MSAPANLFCAHKRLRLSCPECRPPPPPPAPPKAKPARTAAKEPDAEGAAEKKGKGRVEMLPRRAKPKRVSDRAEAEKAEAWWVKKD